MALMVEEYLKGSQSQSQSPRREWSRSSKARNITQQKSGRTSTSLLEAMAKGGNVTSYKAEDGTVRVKILVKKQDLKQILGAMAMNNNNIGNGNGNGAVNYDRRPSTQITPSIERRLYDLMKRRKASSGLAKGSKATSTSTSWRPALQSIPEEH